MKKIVLLLTVVTLFSLKGNAQEFSFGVKGGLNLANLYYLGGYDFSETKMRTGFHAGGMVELRLSELMSIQSELLFSSQGAKNIIFIDDSDSVFDIVPTQEKSKGTLKINYITLPIIGKFYITEGFTTEVGGQLGFLMSAKRKVEVANSDSEEVDLKGEYNSVDLGFNTGLSYRLKNGLNFGARYNFGVRSIPKNIDNTDFIMINSVIQISVGYFFN